MSKKDIGTKEDLVKYRLEKAYNDLRDAKLLMSKESVTGANNRLYYAVFHAITAIHAIDSTITRKHAQAIGEFNKTYINNKEIFDRTCGRKIKEIEDARNTSDYDDFAEFDAKETVENIKFAKEFIGKVKDYCEEKLKIKINTKAQEIQRNKIQEG